MRAEGPGLRRSSEFPQVGEFNRSPSGHVVGVPDGGTDGGYEP